MAGKGVVVCGSKIVPMSCCHRANTPSGNLICHHNHLMLTTSNASTTNRQQYITSSTGTQPFGTMHRTTYGINTTASVAMYSFFVQFVSRKAHHALPPRPHNCPRLRSRLCGGAGPRGRPSAALRVRRAERIVLRPRRPGHDRRFS